MWIIFHRDIHHTLIDRPITHLYLYCLPLISLDFATVERSKGLDRHFCIDLIRHAPTALIRGFNQGYHSTRSTGHTTMIRRTLPKTTTPTVNARRAQVQILEAGTPHE